MEWIFVCALRVRVQKVYCIYLLYMVYCIYLACMLTVFLRQTDQLFRPFRCFPAQRLFVRCFEKGITTVNVMGMNVV